MLSVDGVWTYRSFRNRPEPVQNLQQILFGEGELQIETEPDGKFTDSTLNFGPDLPMVLSGGVLATDQPAGQQRPVAVHFQAAGVTGTQTEGWVYEYIGYLVPDWPNGIDQRPAIVGSVIRVVAHSGGQASAGYVASFVAVKR